MYILRIMYAQSCTSVNKRTNKRSQFDFFIHKRTNKKSQFYINFGVKSKVLGANSINKGTNKRS